MTEPYSRPGDLSSAEIANSPACGGGTADRPVPGALPAPGDRAVAPARGEHIGRDLVALLDKELVLSVQDDLQVRVRIYAGDRRTVLVDVATTAIRALHIAALFKRAAERADPSLVVAQLAAPEPNP